MIRFTKEEKIVLIFLLAALFIGTAVLYYKKLHQVSCKVIECESQPKAGQRQAVAYGGDEIKVENFKKININKATQKELMKIKHVGPVLAERITSYREKYGPFRKAEDIKKVKGIGQKTYEKIKDEIVVE